MSFTSKQLYFGSDSKFYAARSMKHLSKTSTIDETEKVLLGGNYAGLQASFDRTTGVLVPLPDYLIPSAMKEWGQIPTTLEIITSETKEGRLQTTVLPETGCGIDNLETIMKRETFTEVEGIKAMKIIIRESSSGPFIMEAVFPHAVLDSSDTFRCRVSYALDEESKFPIRIIVEKLVTEEPERVMADTSAGGLDGQSVARWLGPALNSETWRRFPEDRMMTSIFSEINLPLGVVIKKNQDFVSISKDGCCVESFLR